MRHPAWRSRCRSGGRQEASILTGRLAGLCLLSRDLEFPHESSVDIVFEDKCQPSMPQVIPLPENPLPVAHIEDEKILAAGVKGPHSGALESSHEIGAENRVLADGIDSYLFKGMSLETYAVAPSKDFRSGSALQIAVYKKPCVLPCR